MAGYSKNNCVERGRLLIAKVIKKKIILRKRRGEIERTHCIQYTSNYNVLTGTGGKKAREGVRQLVMPKLLKLFMKRDWKNGVSE